MIGIAHSAIAAVTATPELELAEEEAAALAKATVPVLDMMDFTPDPRFVAVFGLVTTSVAIYGPRAAMIRMRKAAEKDARMKRVYDTPPPAGDNDPVTATDPFASFGGGPVGSGQMN